MLRLPSARAQVKTELANTRAELSRQLAPKTFPEGITLHDNSSLPEHGRDIEWLRKEWENMHKLDRGDVNAGRVSGAVYHVSGGEQKHGLSRYPGPVGILNMTGIFTGIVTGCTERVTTRRRLAF